ncbi:hypothetical protein D3C73_350070 [compost metagenome]
MKKFTTIFILILLYLLSCWFTNEVKEIAILDASGKDHYTRYHLFYEKFVFFNEQRIVAYDRDIPNFDRIFIAFLVVIYLVFKLIRLIPLSKRKY